MKAISDPKERFFQYVHKTDTCWIWTGCKTEKGYGRFRFEGKSDRSHRVSWTLHHGSIPHGLSVLHRCDNPSCVRPDHLFLGTRADNCVDMYQKGRNHNHEPGSPFIKHRAKGERHGNSKVSNEQVLSMRAEYAQGDIALEKLAVRYGISKRAVFFIIHRITWGHI